MSHDSIDERERLRAIKVDLLEALELCRQAAKATASDPATRFEAIIQFTNDAIKRAGET